MQAASKSEEFEREMSWQARRVRTRVGKIIPGGCRICLGRRPAGPAVTRRIYPGILSISRLGRLYILEDGSGRVIFEHDNLLLLAEQAAAALRNRKQAILAQMAVAWCAMREFYEEKIEPALAEPMEVLSHFAPQIAALA
jgi:hypothetical protein